MSRRRSARRAEGRRAEFRKPAASTREAGREAAADFKRLGVLGDWEQPVPDHGLQVRGRHHPRAGARFAATATCTRASSRCTGASTAARRWPKRKWNMRTSTSCGDRRAFAVSMARLERAGSVPGHEGRVRCLVVIWTTTPWTLPANQAVALNPDLEYVVLVRAPRPSGETRSLVLAEALVEECLEALRLRDRVLAYCKGKALELCCCRHPFYERQVPLILGEHVTAEAGTGAVHTAPGTARRTSTWSACVTALHIDQPGGCARPASCRYCRCSPASTCTRPTSRSSRCSRRAARCARQEDPPQLPALLAPQDADHLPRHPAVVHQHGTARACADALEAIAQVQLDPDWGRRASSG
jgi:hypothetical protein